jgi:hypothetical protein
LRLLQRIRTFFLRVSFVRGGVSVAAGATSGRDLAGVPSIAWARHFVCRSHSFELEIRVYYTNRVLNGDYGVFGCGGMAIGEGKLTDCRSRISDRDHNEKGRPQQVDDLSGSLCSVAGAIHYVP